MTDNLLFMMSYLQMTVDAISDTPCRCEAMECEQGDCPSCLARGAKLVIVQGHHVGLLKETIEEMGRCMREMYNTIQQEDSIEVVREKANAIIDSLKVT